MKKNIILLTLALSFIGVFALSLKFQSYLLFVFNMFGLGIPFLTMVSKNIKSEENQKQTQDIKFNASTQDGAEYELLNTLENNHSTYLSNKTKKETTVTQEKKEIAVEHDNDFTI